MSVPDVPSPMVIAVPSSFVTGPPSADVPSWVCPVDAAKAETSWENSLLKSAA